jgi:hypothetical protein
MYWDARSWFVVSAVAVLSLMLAAPSLAQGRVRGEVEDEYGNKIEGVTITAQPSGPQDPKSATTDDDGRFGMMGVPAGGWLFTAAAEGYVGQEIPVNVSWLELNRVNFELRVAPMGGRFKATTTFVSDPVGTTITFENDGTFVFEDADGEGMGTYGIDELTAALVVREYDGPDDKFSVSDPLMAKFADNSFLNAMMGDQKLVVKQ